jgi:tetratricopeptide (TPR) repeat protein
MKYSILLLFVFQLNVLFSQKKFVLSQIEYQKLQDKTKLMVNSNIDSALIYASSIEKSENDQHKSFAIGIKSYLYQLKGDSIKSKQSYQLAFNYLNRITPSIEKTKLNAYLLSYGGLSEWKRGNLGKALDLYIKGKKMSLKANDIIQVIKFNNNISSIYDDVGNYKSAIAIARESNNLTDKYSYLYSKEKFNQSKTNVNYNLGSFYEKAYDYNIKHNFLLDSAQYFYNQTIIYSDNTVMNNINAKINLGSILKYKKDFDKAEKIYLSILKTDNSNINTDNFKQININLGELYFNQKKYNEALICFKKYDSVYGIENKEDELYMYSCYYQAKIYNIFNDNNNAVFYSKIYLDKNKENASKLSKEILNVNSKIGKASLDKEITEIKDKNKKKVLVNQILIFLAILFFVLIFVLLIWNIQQKKKANNKAIALIKEFKLQYASNAIVSKNNEAILVDDLDKKDASLSIDEEKEQSIYRKLKELEEKQLFLNQDFTLQYVSKKIKTNTTYLSFVVNKRFNKTFSEYANELKINYVINELITNPTYRKYSTQAIAESAGFKKANSFTKSFSKRTGVSPAQFAKNIDNYPVII